MQWIWNVTLSPDEALLTTASVLEKFSYVSTTLFPCSAYSSRRLRQQIPTKYCHVWGVTINGVWFGERIYWPLIHTTRNYKHLQCYHWFPHFTNHYKALAKLFPACCVSNSCSLVTASNSKNSSASHTQVISSEPPVQNSNLNWQLTGFPGWWPFHTSILDFSSQPDFLNDSLSTD